MKKFLLAAAAVTASFAVPAQAADLARPAPVYAPPPPIVAVFTWSGCYVGGNGGGLWSNEDWSDNFGFFGPIGTSLGSTTANGGLGGLQGGCNYQVGNWVFGIQGDYDWASATSSNTTGTGVFPLLAPFGVLGISDSAKVDSLASVTGRIGYAWGRFLGYVKGGGAWVKNDYTIAGTFGPPAAPFVGTGTLASISNTRGGWTIGVGGEYAFLDWLTGFVEYDYYGFSSQSANFNCVAAAVVCAAPATAVPLAVLPVNVTQNINVFKVGLNLKFGSGWW